MTIRDKILIIEDEQSIARFISTILTKVPESNPMNLAIHSSL